jgi:hypothetical protein
VEREEKVYRPWRLGATIDQISLQTQIPRSTVGYYVRKFNRSDRRRLVPEPVAPSAADVSIPESIFTKVLFTEKVMELFKSGDYAKLYYFLQIYKMQMQSYLKFTKDEMDLFQKAINSPVSQTKETIRSKPELTRKKTLSEIFGLDQ